MSMTIPVGVVGASYWAYMASEMAASLERVIRAKRIEPAAVPKGVYYGAIEFLNLVLPTARDEDSDNQLASMKAYLIAADVVRGACGRPSATWADLKECFQGYVSFVERLLTPGELDEAEVKTAEELKRFFLGLAQKGEAEVYDRTVYFERAP